MATSLSPLNAQVRNNVWAVAALLLALIGTAGSLYLSLKLGLKACPLCLYQRTFLMGTFGVLVMAFAAKWVEGSLAAWLALPAAIAGWALAAFHVYLEWSGKLECPAGIAAVGSAPQQSLALLTLLALTLALGATRASAGRRGLLIGTAIVVGIGLAVAAVASAPPMPKRPTKAYEQPLDICRPPYRAT
jgi:disulfide bond formation protein DsbB